jgi:hypothetical protein
MTPTTADELSARRAARDMPAGCAEGFLIRRGDAHVARRLRRHRRDRLHHPGLAPLTAPPPRRRHRRPDPASLDPTKPTLRPTSQGAPARAGAPTHLRAALRPHYPQAPEWKETAGADGQSRYRRSPWPGRSGAAPSRSGTPPLFRIRTADPGPGQASSSGAYPMVRVPGTLLFRGRRIRTPRVRGGGLLRRRHDLGVRDCGRGDGDRHEPPATSAS